MSQKKISLKELAKILECTFIGDDSLMLSGVASIENAQSEDVSFLSSSNYLKYYESTKSGALIVAPDFEHKRSDIAYLVHPSPQKIFRKACHFFLNDIQPTSAYLNQIHPTAVIHDTVVIGKNTSIFPRVVIDQGVTIGDNVIVESGVYIGPEVAIGNNCHIMANVVMQGRVCLENHVIVKPGAVIGGEGFGFTMNDKMEHVRVKHYGTVKVEEKVEIGSNAVVDRAPFGQTIIRQGSKIDNLVLVAHGVSIGAHNIIVGLCGIAGSTKTGNYVFIGGLTGLAGHIKIADGVQISGQSAVTKNISEAGIKYLGNTPARPIKEFRQQQILVRRLPGLYDRVDELEKRIKN